MTGTMIPYRNISVKTAIQMVTNMNVLEDRNNKRYGGEDVTSFRAPERKCFTFFIPIFQLVPRGRA